MLLLKYKFCQSWNIFLMDGKFYSSVKIIVVELMDGKSSSIFLVDGWFFSLVTMDFRTAFLIFIKTFLP